MPRGDKSGPQGQGTMTGRGRGKCSPDDAPSMPANQGGRGTVRRLRRGRRPGRGADSDDSGNGGRGRGRRS